jgi:hypothetical protein
MKIFTQTEVIAAIVGAIVGGIFGFLISILTTLVNSLIRNIGSLTVFSNTSEFQFNKMDSYNGFAKTLNFKEAENIEVRINLDIYNNSEIPKTLGNFKVEISQNRIKSYYLTKIYKRTSSGSPFSENIPPQTILPKQSINIQCKTFLHVEDFISYDSTIGLFLVANFPNKRIFKYKFLEMNIGN